MGAKNKNKLTIKQRLLIAAVIIAAVGFYCIIDQIIYNQRKPALEACARSYVQDIEKLNTYGDDCQPLSTDALADKKAKELMSISARYYLSSQNDNYYSKKMKELVLDMKSNNEKLIDYKISGVKITSQKLPWKFDYDVNAIYKIDIRYKGRADYFDGSAFFNMIGQNGSNQKTDYCLLKLGMKKSNGIMKISRMSMDSSATQAGFDEILNTKSSSSKG